MTDRIFKYDIFLNKSQFDILMQKPISFSFKQNSRQRNVIRGKPRHHPPSSKVIFA